MSAEPAPPAAVPRKIRRVALLIAAIVALLVPALVLVQDWRKDVTEIEVLAAVLSRASAETFESSRGRQELALRRLLATRFEPERKDEMRYVQDAAGKRIITLGEMPAAPLVIRSAEIMAAAAPYGRIVIVRSERHLVALGVIALLLGSTLGTGIYFALGRLSVSEMDKIVAALSDERERSRQLFSYARDAMLSFDDYLRVKDVNKAVEQLFGRDRAALIGQPLGLLFDASDTGDASRGNRWLESAQPFEIAARHADGSLVPVEVSVGRVGESRDVCRIAVLRSIAERKAAEFDLDLFVNYDSLTRLPNRDYFRELLSNSLLRAQARHSTVALLFVDLARFKPINDALGHAIGDKLLCAAARRLQDAVAKADWPGRILSGRAGSDKGMVSRLGGDEFALILEDADVASAKQVAQRLIDAINAPFEIEGRELSIGAYVGIAVFPEHGDFVGKLVRAADLAMYQARNLGRNTSHVYTQLLEPQGNDRLAMEARLRRGLATDAFELHFQPILSLQTDAVAGVEVLLRWQDGADNLLLPPDFLDVLEDSGLILDVGAWVLRTACRQLRSWHDAGHAGLRLSVNLSQHQFDHPDLVGQMAAALSESGIAPACLELALSENTLTQAGEHSAERLAALDALGIRIALERFGTGLSCLASLQQLPLHTLKVDLMFIHGMTESPTSRVIAKTIINLGHSLGMQTVAVGVEQAAQRDMLRSMGCDLYQGYLVTPAMSARACHYWLDEWGSRRQGTALAW